MYAVNVTIKVQNKLAKDSIVLSLKQWSEYIFKKGNGCVLRSFLNKSENEIEIFHIFENKLLVEKIRKENSNQFWNQIKEMGGQVSRVEGECEVEMCSEFKDLNISFK